MWAALEETGKVVMEVVTQEKANHLTPFITQPGVTKGMSSFEPMDIIVELFPNDLLACIVRKTSACIWAALYHRSRSIPGATFKGLS